MTSGFWLPLLTALGYALTGWLSLQLAIPPDYVSLVFLPAGIALGLTIVHGVRVLPGVALGCLVVQWLASQQAGLPALSWTMLVSPLGATLQAWAGAYMARRWAHYPGPLDTPAKVITLLMVISPLSCLLNASMSVPVLVASGLVPPHEALFNWWTWWLGDALGVVLSLPLVLVLLGEPAALWRTRRATVVVPMLLAILLVGAGFLQVKSWELRREQDHLGQLAQELAGLLQRRLDAQNDSVLAVARQMAISGNLSQAEFAESVQTWLRRHAGTQNFGWSPRIAERDRARYEERYQPIMGRSAQGATYAAPTKRDYLPITLIEPLADNRLALGLDITVLPQTAATVAATRANGQPGVTEGFRLVQETGDQRAVVMYQAVYERLNPSRVKGVVSAVFRLDDVLGGVLGRQDPQRLQLCLADTDAAVGNKRLSGPPGCDRASWLNTPMATRLPLYFGGRSWELRVRAEEGFVNELRDWSAWAMLAMSLVCVGMLGAFLLVITGQAHRTQALVDLRTAELAQLAHYDSLTGLPNRSHWMARAQTAVQTAMRHEHALAVVFLDLDHFKRVNDTLGHTLGDELLQTVAQRLLPCLRRDDLLARIGGDEFVALLPRLRRTDDAVAVAEKLLAAMNVPVQLGGNEVSLSVSIGIACFPHDGDSLDTLLKHADTAMYAAKDAGRNGYRFFETEMNQRVSRRMFLENNLRRALERGELFLVYQPQIDAHTTRVTGVEALVRWRHPDEGLIPPDVFIPVAEDSGLIESLGAWVLRQACAQQRAWTAEGLDQLMVAVNISPLQFRKPGFVDVVRDALAHSGADASRIELEITETLLMQPLQELDERLGELAALGLTFALDDFGTGYCSLGYLRRLPISRIKLDKSFVKDLPGDVEDAAVARATLSMAKDLGLRTVAEGVETEAQQRYLLANGCDYLQGYLFARPMLAQDCRLWIAQQAAQLTSATASTAPAAV